MDKYEFSGFDEKTQKSETVAEANESSFLDFIDGDDYIINKFRKKTKKALKGNKKKIKELKSHCKDFKKRISALEADAKAMKKSARDSKISELLNSSDINECKRIAKELLK